MPNEVDLFKEELTALADKYKGSLENVGTLRFTRTTELVIYITFPSDELLSQAKLEETDAKSR